MAKNGLTPAEYAVGIRSAFNLRSKNTIYGFVVPRNNSPLTQ